MTNLEKSYCNSFPERLMPDLWFKKIILYFIKDLKKLIKCKSSGASLKSDEFFPGEIKISVIIVGHT